MMYCVIISFEDTGVEDVFGPFLSWDKAAKFAKKKRGAWVKEITPVPNNKDG